MPRRIKICTKCGVGKARSEFYRDIKSKDGLSYWCKACSYTPKPKRERYTSNDKKICSKCGLEKHVTEFYINRKAYDGLTSQCKACLDK